MRSPLPMPMFNPLLKLYYRTIQGLVIDSHWLLIDNIYSSSALAVSTASPVLGTGHVPFPQVTVSKIFSDGINPTTLAETMPKKAQGYICK